VPRVLAVQKRLRALRQHLQGGWYK